MKLRLISPVDRRNDDRVALMLKRHVREQRSAAPLVPHRLDLQRRLATAGA